MAAKKSTIWLWIRKERFLFSCKSQDNWKTTPRRWIIVSTLCGRSQRHGVGLFGLDYLAQSNPAFSPMKNRVVYNSASAFNTHKRKEQVKLNAKALFF